MKGSLHHEYTDFPTKYNSCNQQCAKRVKENSWKWNRTYQSPKRFHHWYIFRHIHQIQSSTAVYETKTKENKNRNMLSRIIKNFVNGRWFNNASFFLRNWTGKIHYMPGQVKVVKTRCCFIPVDKSCNEQQRKCALLEASDRWNTINPVTKCSNKCNAYRSRWKTFRVSNLHQQKQHSTK